MSQSNGETFAKSFIKSEQFVRSRRLDRIENDIAEFKFHIDVSQGIMRGLALDIKKLKEKAIKSEMKE